MPSTIRSATAADIPEIHALIRELAEYEKLTAAVRATPEQLTATLFGAHPYAEVFMAEVDGAVVGFALFFHTYSTFLAQPGIYLEDLFVRPAYRAQGIGRALLTRLAQLAVERGCGRLEWAVLDWNEPAIGFYRRLGAVPLEEWTGYRLTGAALEILGQR